MKTIAKFESFNHEFAVKVIKRETGTNHNQFCHVFHEKEKTPLMGTSFNDNATKEGIIEWAKNSVKQLQAEELAQDIFKHRRPRTAEERYLELENHAKVLFTMVANNINAIVRSGYLKSNCPYPGQCILELLIKKLEEAV